MERIVVTCSCTSCRCQMVFDKFKDGKEEVCPCCSVKCLKQPSAYRKGLNVQVDEHARAIWVYHQNWQFDVMAKLRSEKGLQFEGMLARASYPPRLEPPPRRTRVR